MNEKMMIPENSFKDLCEVLAKLMGEEKIGSDDCYISYNVPSSFWYNRTWLSKNANIKLNNIIEEVLNNQSSIKPTLITYTKEVMDNELGKMLHDRGYINIVSQIGMITQLKDYTPTIENPNIIRIDNSRVNEWSDVVTKAFEKSPELDAYKALIDNEDCYFYAYLHEGKIVGTAMFYANPENAGIHEVGTLPEYRRMGIANSMIYKILNVVKELNIPIASLQASETGEKVYSCLGFEKVSLIPTWIKED